MRSEECGGGDSDNAEVKEQGISEFNLWGRIVDSAVASNCRKDLLLPLVTNWLKPKPVVMTRAIVGPWRQAWGIPYGPGNLLKFGFVIPD